MGQRDLRRLLITGAMAVVRHAARRGSAADPWLVGAHDGARLWKDVRVGFDGHSVRELPATLEVTTA